MRAGSRIHAAVRIFRSTGRAGTTIRCEPTVRYRDSGDENGQLHRLDEVLLLHLRDRESGNIGAVRLHAGRLAGWRSARGAPSLRVAVAATCARIRASY